MKNSIITEFVNFSVLEKTTVDQIILKANLLNDFQKRFDGYYDAELVKNNNENEWCIVYHYQSFDKVQIIGKELRASNEFKEFISLIDPESLKITFNYQVSKW